jgi:A/G-specific adenine glycosylase
MIGLPTSDWSEAPEAVEPVAADWRDAGAIEHVFTHFSLTLQVRVATAAAPDVIWLDEAEAMATLPTVFAKALVRAAADR